jgi:hypothetical protein
MSTNTEPQQYQDLMAKDVQMHGRAQTKFQDPEPNNICLTAGSEEMLKVAEDGFYVRGVKVEQGPKEAEQVYEAFKQWLTWASLTR